ncbi:S41 family peptidase [Caulobacter sp. 73W]|uniref:S41 family peptidase n=1 Tax=Caulobacter sp. 73W TaxID=3161137 RepID=A0AB39KRZ1_9CAUL
MKSAHLKRLLPALALSLLLTAGSQAESPPLIAPEALRADLRLATQTIEETHPDLAHSVAPRDLRAAAAKIERDLDHPMTQAEAWATMARLNPVMADGHVMIGLPDWRAQSVSALANGTTYFPFEVTVDELGRLRIVSELGGAPSALAGKRIARINGTSADEVAKRLLGLAHGDTPRMRAALVSQRWWLFYAKVYGTPAGFDLHLEGGHAMRIAASSQTPVILRQDADFDRLFQCEITPRGAVLTIKAFQWSDKQRFLAFTQTCFEQVKAAGADRLVIDIRENGGGDDDFWKDGVLPYIATRPYKHGSTYLARVLEPRAPGQVKGQIISGAIETATTPPASEPLRFEREVDVLIGPLTYSSAVLFSNVVQDYGFGALYGAGEAVRTRQTGGVRTLKLPGSGLIVSYPRFVLDRPSGSAKPIYLTPDRPLPNDPLHPRAAIEALLNQ